MSKLKLYKPMEIDGRKVSEIEYDLDSVTGQTYEKSFKALSQIGHVVLTQETDAVLHAYIFAEAAGIDINDMRRMHAIDYAAASSCVRDFFFGVSEDSQPANTSGT